MMSISNRFARATALATLPLLLLICASSQSLASQIVLQKQDIARALTPYAIRSEFPDKLSFTTAQGQEFRAKVDYTFDQNVHREMAKVYLQYQPDYACFVAIDVETGAILNLTSFIKADEKWDNLVLRADYPAASVFKVITAAAGIDTGVVGPQTVIPFNGKSTSLYKSQVLRHKTTKWTRTPTFKESFARSVNAVFGRLGVFQIGGEVLRSYAHRFGFDQSMNSDFNLPMSRLDLSFEDQWQIAEAASGYTKEITLSPVHAAQIAATIANDGKLVTPYMVAQVSDANGAVVYEGGQTGTGDQVVSTQTAKHLRSLMQATTKIGSARKSFNNIGRYRIYRDMEIGGKTGSLTGYSPRGRHDWFMGYAEKNGRKVAFASLIINKEKWYVRSAYVARQFIYHYFTDYEARFQAAAE